MKIVLFCLSCMRALEIQSDPMHVLTSIFQQLLMLEATLLFGGMGIHDQHSDLRLDVDNMSYEVPHFSVVSFYHFDI